jgi:hypothetical protein
MEAAGPTRPRPAASGGRSSGGDEDQETVRWTVSPTNVRAVQRRGDERACQPTAIGQSLEAQRRKQQGTRAANVIARRVAGKPAPRPFHYHDWGRMANLGRSAAVGKFGRLEVRAPSHGCSGALPTSGTSSGPEPAVVLVSVALVMGDPGQGRAPARRVSVKVAAYSSPPQSRSRERARDMTGTSALLHAFLEVLGSVGVFL